MKKIINNKLNSINLDFIRKFRLDAGQIIGSLSREGHCGFLVPTHYASNEWRHYAMYKLNLGNGYDTTFPLPSWDALIGHISFLMNSGMRFYVFDSERELFQWMLDNNKD